MRPWIRANLHNIIMGAFMGTVAFVMFVLFWRGYFLP